MDSIQSQVNKKVLFVLPFNELSGSVISATRLKKALESHNNGEWVVDYCLPENEFIKADVIIPKCRKNPLTLFSAYCVVKSVSHKYDAVIYFTVLFGMLCPLFSKKDYIYIHEVDIGNGLIPSIVLKLINLAKNSIWVVNPKMLDIYPSAKLLPNISTEKQPSVRGKFSPFDFLMVCNLKKSKGIYILINIAKSLPNSKFVLLTNCDLADKNELASYIAQAPTNLFIETNQSYKHDLFSSAKYLLNLSTLEETFGLTLLEAIAYRVIPISFKNMGSLYCLSENAYFIDKLDPVNSLLNILNNIEKDHLSYIGLLESYVKENFSAEYVCQKFISNLQR